MNSSTPTLQPANAPAVLKMCRWLEVSRSGFNHWRSRPVSATAARRVALVARARYFFEESERTYGYRRVHADLADKGTECSPELVRQIMRQEGLVPCRPRPFRTTTEADAAAAAAMPDLVQRDFTADCPGIKFVGDITYIHPWQGFIYLATVIDCSSKKVLGWAIEDHMRAELVEQALRNAAATTRIEPGAISHSNYAEVLVKPRNSLELAPWRETCGSLHGSVTEQENSSEKSNPHCLWHRIPHDKPNPWVWKTD